MIDRLLGFWQSIRHFFQFFFSILGEIGAFVPVYIQGALAVVFACAMILFIAKLIKGFLNVVAALSLGFH